MHIVSAHSLRSLHLRDSSTNLNLRLNSYVFMESLIERAKIDQSNNQQTLLFDLVNVKNDDNIVSLIF